MQPEKFVMKMQKLDAGELIAASERLIGLTDALNLEDCNKSLLFLSYPIHDFERLRAQTREVKKICGSYSLDKPFDDSLFRKMKVLVYQLSNPRELYIAYSELKAQLCLEETEFFDEVYASVAARLESCFAVDKMESLTKAVGQIRSIYDVYL